MIKKKASFRGVGFYVTGHETTVGRRQPTYAIPFQDKGALAVDIGRSPRRFSISAILVGDTHADDRDALLEALEQPGPGLLVHPVYGRVLVVIGDDIVITEHIDEGLKVTVAFRATEAAEQPQQTNPLDSAGQLKSKISIAKEIVGASFSNPVTGLKKAISDFVANAHLDVLDRVLSDMHSINNAIASVLSIPSGFTDQIDAISLQAVELLKTPRRLFDAVDNVFVHLAQAVHRVAPRVDGQPDEEVVVFSAGLNRTRGSYGSLLGAIDPMASLGSSAPPVPLIDTVERRDQLQAQNAIQQHLRAAGLLSLADGAIDSRYDNAVDARLIRDRLATALAALADNPPDLSVELSTALKDVAAALIAHLSLVAGGLADITSYTPVDTLPVEVLAWTLYGDPERSDEIITRNPVIAHPSFVPGKTPLEVKTS